MITLNNRDCQWEESLTVERLLALKKYTFPKIIVKVNGVYIPAEDYANTPIHDGDDVKAIHLLAGG